ncbi:hypothetical protein BH20BAC1_BH20BAC1_15940 [soil metagenome]
MGIITWFKKKAEKIFYLLKKLYRSGYVENKPSHFYPLRLTLVSIVPPFIQVAAKNNLRCISPFENSRR